MQLREAQPADHTVRATELVGRRLSSARFGSIRRRVIRVADEEVLGGEPGRRSRQPIVLVPEDGELGGAIVCGWLDAENRRSELEAYAVASQAFHERYGVPIDLSRTEYHRVLDTIEQRLRGLDISTRMTPTPRVRPFMSDPGAAQPRRVEPRDRLGGLTLLAGGALLGFSVCYALFAFGVF